MLSHTVLMKLAKTAKDNWTKGLPDYAVTASVGCTAQDGHRDTATLWQQARRLTGNTTDDVHTIAVTKRECCIVLCAQNRERVERVVVYSLRVRCAGGIVMHSLLLICKALVGTSLADLVSTFKYDHSHLEHHMCSVACCARGAKTHLA